MKVPLLDLKAQYRELKPQIDKALLEVAESQEFILGPRVEKFEKELAAYCRCRYAVGVTSGTDALLLALMAFGVKPGDEVITTPFTFFATAGSIARLCAVPVFVDIQPDTFNIDPALIEKRITKKTRAIMPVHLYGQTADMQPILDIARRHGVAVIEDAAQCIGADEKMGRASSLGEMGCLSFYPTKNLGAFGQGGAVTTNDEALYKRLRVFREHGETKRYYYGLIGGNFRLDAIQASVLSVKLERLDKWTSLRQQHAALYTKLFQEKGLAGGAVIAPKVTQPRHVFNAYTIRAQKRDELQSFLASKEIATKVFYPLPLHLQECFAHLGYKKGALPESERAAETVLSLPIYAEMSEEQVRYVVECVGEFYAGR